MALVTQKSGAATEPTQQVQVAAGSGSAATEHTTGSGSAATEHTPRTLQVIFIS